jgi:hypothetical protein
LEEVQHALADCLDGDITQGDIEHLLSFVVGMSVAKAGMEAGIHTLKRALGAVLNGQKDCNAMVTRVASKVRAVLAPGAADLKFIEEVKRLCLGCADADTRQGAAFELLQLFGESFASVAGKVVEPLVKTALMRAGFSAGSEAVELACKGIQTLLKSPEAAKDQLEAVVQQCREIVDGGMSIGEAVDVLPRLLESLGLDLIAATWMAMEPALDHAWALVGLDPSCPMLGRVTKRMRELATNVGSSVVAPRDYLTAICERVRELGTATSEADAGRTLEVIFGCLECFGVEKLEAMSVLLSSLLGKVLGVLQISDSLVVGRCRRNAAALVNPCSRKGAGSGAGSGALSATDKMQGALEAMMSIVMNAGAASMEQAMSLLQMFGVAANDVKLAVVSGVFLRSAISKMGVPANHPFQTEVRAAVQLLAERSEVERAMLADDLMHAIKAAAAAAMNGESVTSHFVFVLNKLDVGSRSIGAVLAPLVILEVFKRVGVPKDHPFGYQAARAARTAIVHAQSLDEVTSVSWFAFLVLMVLMVLVLCRLSLCSV